MALFDFLKKKKNKTEETDPWEQAYKAKPMAYEKKPFLHMSANLNIM